MLSLNIYCCVNKSVNLCSWCFHSQLVSSYKGKFGYVQYFVKAMLERLQQPTMECKKSFEVEEPLDVNTPDLLVSWARCSVRTQKPPRWVKHLLTKECTLKWLVAYQYLEYLYSKTLPVNYL